MSGKFSRLILCGIVYALLACGSLSALRIAPVQMEIDLTSTQQDILRDFAKSLEKEKFHEEARFYHFVAKETIVTHAILVQNNKEFFIIAPASIASLSNTRSLIITTQNGKSDIIRNLQLKQKNDVLWLFQTSGNENILSQAPFINTRAKEESLDWLFNLTLLSAPNIINTLSASGISHRYEILGSIVLGAELQPIGILVYVNGQIAVSPIKDISSLILSQPTAAWHQPSLASLTSSGEKFSQEMQEENLAQSADFFSLDLIYRFGHAAYLVLRSSIKTQNLVTRADIRKAGLAPLRKALIAFFNEQIYRDESSNFHFRIVVSLADEPVHNSSIVTFSLNKNIVSTSWRWQEGYWLMETLPLSVEDQLVPFLKLGQQEVLTPPLLPFSGLTLGLGTSFLPQDKIPSASLGYHYNLNKYLSLDFSIGYDALWYRNFYQIPGIGDFSANFTAEFITLKTGLRLQYPLIIMNRVYIMPFVGINMNAAFLIQKNSSAHVYFDELLISRLPLTLLIGWNTGLELGFRAGVPMGLGISVFYQQDFFGHQTLKTGPSGSINPSGGADLYYISLYYKIALTPNGTHSK